jgi:arylsulfatase A-like enzyme
MMNTVDSRSEGDLGARSRGDEYFAPESAGRFRVLVLSVWCGLVSGLLEVGTIVLRKRTFDPNHLYEMSRHFVWLIPLTNLCLFLALGVILKVLHLAWPRPVSWLAPRILCSLTLVPVLLVGLPQIHGLAWLVMTLGVAARLVPTLERHGALCRRLVRFSFPVVASLVPILAAALWGGDWIKERRQSNRPLPRPASPNVLLIVLDTVAADHLSLYGYERPTSPTLVELAERGIRFDRVQATSSWTLPSHASMFTGRWPHELSAGWLTPLDRTYPTLPEFLSSRGYATAGFVANYWYCASDSGLERGFARYEDYIFPKLTAVKSASLVNRSVKGIQGVERFLEDRLDIDLLRTPVQRLWLQVSADRKDAAMVNREFLDWLTRRRQPERPFFAFLNYYDAHVPYQLPSGRIHRFGIQPIDARESDMIENWWPMDKRAISPGDIAFAHNAYDDCVADLDEELGRLFDKLGQRAVLDTTWVIIAGDHGESFGEHAGVFCHGTSLYQTELHVPLVIIPPGGSPSKRVVTETVSLRNLAATIVDVLDFETGSTFPGKSLARFWDEASPSPPADQTLSEVVPIDPVNPDPLKMVKPHWPLAAVNEGGWTYIRREGDVHEELFHLRVDAKESRNLAGSPDASPELELMRGSLSGLTAGPLTRERFNP